MVQTRHDILARFCEGQSTYDNCRRYLTPFASSLALRFLTPWGCALPLDTDPIADFDGRVFRTRPQLYNLPNSFMAPYLRTLQIQLHAYSRTIIVGSREV